MLNHLDKHFQGFADSTTFCRNIGLYVHTGEKPNQSKDKINQIKLNRGVTVVSINIKTLEPFSQGVKVIIF